MQNMDVEINFKNILVAVDDSDDALLAFKYAISRAKSEGAKLTIVSVLEDEEINVFQSLSGQFVHGKYEDLEKHLEKYKKTAEEAGVADVNVIASTGEAGETIIKDVVPKVNPDLLIVGSESKKGLARHFGSQAAYMAKYSPVSVMVIR
ncbi:Putative universal stress protein [Apilactobacillus kunkeei]|nr:Putative universal stress protein [Apilactobacillus kunkeei]CAI2551400.1 Putative universal stress protein [Apilactobacillus kunkeei]CAI2800968.1 Putative universal stress protein [Apilactobacillus kunkeei]